MTVWMTQTATAREDVSILKEQAILVISASVNLGTSEDIVKKVCYIFLFTLKAIASVVVM